MTKQELEQLKEDYKSVKRVFEIMDKKCSDFENKEWNKHQGEFHARSCLRKMEKEYSQRLIETIL